MPTIKKERHGKQLCFDKQAVFGETESVDSESRRIQAVLVVEKDIYKFKEPHEPNYFFSIFFSVHRR
jgi:hypothetical protein